MKIIIRSKNIEPNETIDDFIEEKIGGLKKFIDILRKDGNIGKPVVEVFMEVEKETRHHQKGPFFRAEAQMHLPGKSIRSEAKRENLKLAIVEVKDELQQEIKKYKLKTIEFNRRKMKKKESSNM